MLLPLVVASVLLAAVAGVPRAQEEVPGDACLFDNMVLHEEDGQCYRPGERGPCPLWQTFQVDRQGAVTGDFRGTCATLCPQGEVRRAADGRCVPYPQMCPVNEGYRPIKNIYGEVECIQAKKPQRRLPNSALPMHFFSADIIPRIKTLADSTSSTSAAPFTIRFTTTAAPPKECSCENCYFNSYGRHKLPGESNACADMENWDYVDCEQCDICNCPENQLVNPASSVKCIKNDKGYCILSGSLREPLPDFSK